MAKVAPDIETPSGACRATVSVFAPPRSSFTPKTRTNTPTGIVSAENLAQSLQRKVCGPKTSHNRPNGKIVGRKPRAIAPPESLWPENLTQSAQRKVCRPKTSRNRPNETVLGRKTCSIARHGSVWAGCPPQDFRDFMAESQPEAFGRCFGKRWPTVGLGLPTRSVIQDLRREMLPFCDLPSPLEKCGSVFLIFPKPEAMVSHLRLSSQSLRRMSPSVGDEAQPRAAGYLRVRLPLRAFLHRGAAGDLYGGRAPRTYYIMCNPKWRADVPHR